MRTLLRAVLILIVVVGLGFLVLGWWAGSSWSGRPHAPSSQPQAGSHHGRSDDRCGAGADASVRQEMRPR